MKKCSNCGAEIDKSSTFCPICGKKQQESNDEKINAQSFINDHKEFLNSKINKEKLKDEFNLIMDSTTSRINSWTGGKGAVKVSLLKFFSSVFKTHKEKDAEHIFDAGTSETTPSLEEVANDNVQPWLFSRILLYILFFGTLLYSAIGLSKGDKIFIFMMTLFVSSAVPISILILLFEVNVFKNISIYQIIKITLLGGILAIISTFKFASLAPKNLPSNDFKYLFICLLVMFLVHLAMIVVATRFVKKLDAKSILNGLLIGGAVGAGFSIFDNASIFLNNLVYDQNTLLYDAIAQSVGSFATFTPSCAIITAALVMVKGSHPLTFQDVLNIKFLRFFILMIAMQTVLFWSSTSHSMELYFVAFIISLVITWIIIFVMIHAGLQQVRKLQIAVKGDKLLEK